MSRGYHVEVARHAAQTDAKWVDNLLSHFDIPGAIGGRQGVARRLSTGAIRRIVLVRGLTRDLGVGLEAAVSLAERLLTTDAVHVSVAPALTLRLDRSEFEEAVDSAVAEAVETMVPARRGRPALRR